MYAYTYVYVRVCTKSVHVCICAICMRMRTRTCNINIMAGGCACASLAMHMPRSCAAAINIYSWIPDEIPAPRRLLMLHCDIQVHLRDVLNFYLELATSTEYNVRTLTPHAHVMSLPCYWQGRRQ